MAMATPIKIAATIPKIIRFNMLLVGTTRLKYFSLLINYYLIYRIYIRYCRSNNLCFLMVSAITDSY
jgi:hypothetical protein